jgi:hypothetical protein
MSEPTQEPIAKPEVTDAEVSAAQAMFDAINKILAGKQIADAMLVLTSITKAIIMDQKIDLPARKKTCLYVLSIISGACMELAITDAEIFEAVSELTAHQPPIHEPSAEQTPANEQEPS